MINQITSNMDLTDKNNYLGYRSVDKDLFENEFSKNDPVFFMQISDDCMDKILRQSDYVLVKRQATLKNDDIGLICVNNTNAIFRKYTQHENFIFLECMSNNSNCKRLIIDTNIDKIKIIGKALGGITKF